MTPSEYVKNVLKTESRSLGSFFQRMRSERSMRLFHAQIGMQTEVAEFADILKKHIMYGKPFDKEHAVEEISDALWYIAVALDELGTSFEEVMEKNINKLKARYKDKFTEGEAIERNVKKEHEALHGKTENTQRNRVLARQGKRARKRKPKIKKTGKTS